MKHNENWQKMYLKYKSLPNLSSLVFFSNVKPSVLARWCLVQMKIMMMILVILIREGVKKNCEKAVRLTAWVDPPQAVRKM